MGGTQISLSLDFAPLFSEPVMQVLAVCFTVLLLLSLFLYRQGLLWRGICTAGFLLVLLNPSVTEEEYEGISDIAVIVADQSPSQSFGKRAERRDQALNYLKETLGKKSGLELRVVPAPTRSTALASETRLFEALEQGFADIPESRRAGAILLTDGQIHDVPQDTVARDRFGPIHTFLTGEHDEKDRQLVIKEAPAYGIVGQKVTVRYRIEDSNERADGYASVTIRQNDVPDTKEIVPVNQDLTLQIPIRHAGQNIIDMETETLNGEITAANNKAHLLINGVRDRLRVLLVSGQPHAGERTWRDILTADPGVDLVHFTILREPDKLDATPQNELSLIAFPFQELFEIKLYDFDLIIFDRYRLNRILPQYYFTNIARYVKEGGALLEASGPSYAGDESIYTTSLRDILPARPQGGVIEAPYLPALTEIGGRHPVTQDLSWQGGNMTDTTKWGRWLRQVNVTPEQGHVLMTGAEKSPLLILDHVGKGRVAQLASDHIWLWSRGYEGGGPHAELLRRLAHWLMKEPDLAENALEVQAEANNTLLIRRRTLKNEDISVTVTTPSGAQKTVPLEDSRKGWKEARMAADELGIYNVDDGEKNRFAIIGALNPPELRAVKTTEEHVGPLANASKGGVIWLSDHKEPAVRFMNDSRQYAGDGWIALRENRARDITGIKNKPLLPDWVYALLLLALAISAWWFEGRSPEKRSR